VFDPVEAKNGQRASAILLSGAKREPSGNIKSLSTNKTWCSHPPFGRLCPLLNRKILNVALLRLRFCSIVTAISSSKSGAIPEKLICG
jgi:hypothetical protein